MTVDDATQRLLDELSDAIDENDTKRFPRPLSDDSILRCGSAPQGQCQCEIRNAVNEFLVTHAGCQHALPKIPANDGPLVCEGAAITRPFADAFEFAGNLISRYRIYADAAPLYADE